MMAAAIGARIALSFAMVRAMIAANGLGRAGCNSNLRA
jgi:hypothetical protein